MATSSLHVLHAPTTSPPGVDGAASTTDWSAGSWLIFGGERADGSLSADVWRNGDVTWTRLWDGTGGGGPSARRDAGFAMNPCGNRAVLFGGRDGNGTLLDDTWILNLANNTWALVDTSGTGAPAARADHVLSSLPDGVGTPCSGPHRAVLFGGLTAAGAMADTWTFDFVASEWTERSDVTGPAARIGAVSAAWSDGKVLLAGGVTSDGSDITVLRDAWLWNAGGDTWSAVADMVYPRAFAAATPRNDTLCRFYVWGGLTESAGVEELDSRPQCWRDAGTWGTFAAGLEVPRQGWVAGWCDVGSCTNQSRAFGGNDQRRLEPFALAP